MSDPTMPWWRLAAAAALVLVLALSGLLWLRNHPGKRTCAPPPPFAALRLPAPQLETPVLLAAPPEVTLSLDGAPAPPGGVVRAPPGKHTLRAESPGLPPLSLDFRLVAFDAAVFEVEPQGKYLSLVYLGADCATCASGNDEQQLLPQEAASAPFSELEDAAAQALQKQDWAKAAQALKQVQPHERELTRFKRLAQNVLQSSGAHAEARAQLLGITGSPHLDGVLGRYDELARFEVAREHQHWLTRWNALTELYQRLLALQDDAPQVLDPASSKLATVSAAFTRAAKEQSAEGERDAAEQAEAVVTELVKSLRAFHPDDCDLQEKLTAAL